MKKGDIQEICISSFFRKTIEKHRFYVEKHWKKMNKQSF